jgi:hypothetical protein
MSYGIRIEESFHLVGRGLAGGQHHARNGAAGDGAGLDRARSGGIALRADGSGARGAGGVGIRNSATVKVTSSFFQVQLCRSGSMRS